MTMIDTRLVRPWHFVAIVAVAGLVGAFASAGTAAAQPAAGISCGQIIPQCVQCSGGGNIVCQRCKQGYGVRQGECQQCTSIDAKCTECSEGACTACAGGYQLQNGKCVACTTIDPNCQSCRGGSCTGCAGGYGVAVGGKSCQQCSAIAANCTVCGNGKCTACAAGYGTAGGGASCQACSSINANCTTCSEGTCSNCTNGFAANLQGQCVTPGTPSCSFNTGGQCCKCPYECQGFNPTNGSCVGAPANGCGGCQDRQ
jgi:hypothetical protein